jgi:hypothetical protein
MSWRVVGKDSLLSVEMLRVYAYMRIPLLEAGEGFWPAAQGQLVLH